MAGFARIAAIAVTLSALPACAQPAPAPPPAANDADPALWVVKDRDTTIYLFGTVHVLKPGLSWFDEAVRAAFDKSQSVVLEMVQPDAQTMQSIVAARAMSPASAPPLTETLPADKRAAYAKAMADVGLPANAFDRMKPWFAAVNLSLLPLMKSGYDPNQGPEQVLTAAAKAANKPVSGLETAEQQIGYFDALSAPAQVTFLTGTVDELPNIGETMASMVADWSKGDAEALGKLMNDKLKDTPEVAKLLLFDRNARWADWIARRMKEPGVVFVAVGAGHLAGHESVIDKLKPYKLKAVRVKY